MSVHRPPEVEPKFPRKSNCRRPSFSPRLGYGMYGEINGIIPPFHLCPGYIYPSSSYILPNPKFPTSTTTINHSQPQLSNSKMDVHKTPYLKSLSNRGHIKGSTLTSKATNKPLCHFFGGLRYALAPSERWRRAHQLPELYSYGTREHPGQHEGLSSVCPQPGFLGPADESAWSEDCFHCNVWVPIEEPPKGGMLCCLVIKYLSTLLIGE